MPADIPEPEQLLGSVLQSLSDGAEHSLQDTVSHLASELQLDQEALSRRTPSGQHPLFYDRVCWSRWDLKEARCVEIPRRGYTRITDRGREALTSEGAQIDRTYLRSFPEFLAYTQGRRLDGGTDEVTERLPIDEAGVPISDPTVKRNVWIEKTLVEGRPDRIAGDYALGKLLWSPVRDKSGKDIYHFMRDVAPGDIVLHLTDNRGFTGVSIASEPVIETVGVHGSDWEGAAYAVKLSDFTVLEPPLLRDVFFSEPFRTQLVALRNSGLKNTFYSDAPALNQGKYLTPAPPELVDVLNDAYKSVSGKPLIDIRSLPTVPEPRTPSGMNFSDLEKLTLWRAAELRELIDALSGNNRQIVLAGPPGTGKTYIARQLARFLTQDDITRYRIVQFHQSYTYEQFMEGLRPVMKDGGIEFAPVPGVVLEISDAARKSPLAHYLIIDEMNRANIQRVFGELMFLLEYRDEQISLAYSRNFSLPDNLYFIGTMNTADRSIRNIDVALRRRFEVFDCEPSARILAAYYKVYKNEVADLIAGFEKLNDRLTTDLDRYHTIGHSFFMAEHFTYATLRSVWKRRVRPLIEELFFDEPDKLSGLTLEALWPSVVGRE